MKPARKSGLVEWLGANGAMIDRDAEVSITQAKSGHVITFTWSYDGRRALRLTFSGMTAEERKVAMVGYLNGDFLPKGGAK